MSAVIELEETISAPQSQSNGNGFTEYRLPVETYEKMIELGVFNDDDKIEMWKGKLVTMSQKGTRHTNKNKERERKEN